MKTNTDKPEQARNNGKYAKGSTCHGCGKTVVDYLSDDEALELPGSSWAGLIICARKRCSKRLAKLSVTERIEVYQKTLRDAQS